MSKIIYITGKEMRETNLKNHPEWFKEDGDKTTIKHYFRGEPVVKLLSNYRYLRFLKFMEKGMDLETAYFKAATFTIRKYNA